MPLRTDGKRRFETANRANVLKLCAVFMAILILAAAMAAINLNTPVVSLVNGSGSISGDADARRVYMVVGQVRKYEGVLDPSDLEGLQYTLSDDIRFERYMAESTYRFVLKADPGWNFYMARTGRAQVWINGAKVGSDSGIDSYTLYALDEYADGGVCEFVIAVPKSKGSQRGYRGILLGTEEVLTGLKNTLAVADLVSIGLYIMAAALCLSLFVQKRSEKHLLLLSVIALMLLARWLPTVRFAGFDRMESPLLLMFGKAAAFMRFFVVYPFLPDPPRTKARPIVVALFLLWFVIALASTQDMQDIAFIPYLILEGVVLISGLKKGCPGSGILVCGWTVIVSLELFYMLLNVGLLPQGLIDVYIQPMPYSGLNNLVCCTVAALGVFARKYRYADEMSVCLERKVEERTAELKEANDRLSRAQIDKQRFMADVAHNLRNPLFALGGYFDLFTKATPNPTEQQQRSMDRAEAKLMQISKMVDGILCISRLQDDRIEFHFTEFEISDMLEALRADASIKAAEKGITLEIVSDGAPAVMIGDRFWLQQAFENLLDNAIRHSQKGSKIILRAEAAENDRVRISVADSGCGISEEMLPRIFERYERGDSNGSVGLGLPISREIARRHGGELYIESTLNAGTTAIIECPLLQ